MKTADKAGRRNSLLQWHPKAWIEASGVDSFQDALAQTDPDLRKLFLQTYEFAKIPGAQLYEISDLRVELNSWNEQQLGRRIAQIILLRAFSVIRGTDDLNTVEEHSDWVLRLTGTLLSLSTVRPFQMTDDEFLLALHFCFFSFRTRKDTSEPLKLVVSNDNNLALRLIGCHVENPNFSVAWLPVAGELIDDIVSAWDWSGPGVPNLLSLKRMVELQSHFLKLSPKAHRRKSRAVKILDKQLRIEQKLLTSFRKKEELAQKRKRKKALSCSAIDKKLSRTAKQAVHVSVLPRPIPDGQPLPLSYLGGMPQLPANMEWPNTHDGKTKKSFVGQIRLNEVPDGARLGLPKNGLLLFFVDAFSNRSDLDGEVFFIEENDIPEIPTDAPGNLSLPINAPSDYPWLGDDDVDLRTDFCREILFAPIETYPDITIAEKLSETTFSDDNYDEYCQLYDQRSLNAHRLAIGDVFKQRTDGAVVRRPSQAPASDFNNPMADFNGGPYTWADVKLLCGHAEAQLKVYCTQEEYDLKGQPYSPLSNMGEDAEKLVADAYEYAKNWLDEANSRPEWEGVPSGKKQSFLGGLGELIERYKVAQANQRSYIDTLKAAHDDLPRLEREKQPFVWPRYWFPYSQEQIIGQLRGVVALNVLRCASQGQTPEELYPQWLVDKWAPERHVGEDVFTIDEAGEFVTQINGEAGNQMLGYGYAYQGAPHDNHDKALLLQIIEGAMSWYGQDNCVCHFWISKRDLKQRRFDRAFATLECS